MIRDLALLVVKPVPTFRKMLVWRPSLALPAGIVIAYALLRWLQASLAGVPQSWVLALQLVAGWLAVSLAVYLAGRLLGGRASLYEVLLVLGLTFVVALWAAPLVFLSWAIGGSGPLPLEVVAWVAELLVTAAAAWHLGLAVLGIRESEGMSFWRAAGLALVGGVVGITALAILGDVTTLTTVLPS